MCDDFFKYFLGNLLFGKERATLTSLSSVSCHTKPWSGDSHL